MRVWAAIALVALVGCGGNDDRRADAGGGGGLCGDTRLQGEVLLPVVDRGACGIADPVRITRIDGVEITGGPVMDCRTARAFADWTVEGAARAARNGGRQLTRIETVASYACRNRYGRSSGRISNHALGRAVDVSAFGFADGGRISVLRDWLGTTILQEAAGRACGPFNTVLGPNYNAAHADHLHLDVTDEYRTFCR
ncbi:extensin family protein [Roseobacter sp. HKCCA0434]|uniref:extensin-like domain-containing protein n=1 Tax=Roseobacter sp. HKCCA0434 TaxID=3079297 RepID=UPI002905C218|nr:extensin family protein [Roseobacter sp. HKCCA0434]